MLIEVHTLTSHAPANLNRDDLGRPKSALFGGHQRGRVSSQSVKKSIRSSSYLQSELKDRTSTRSRILPERIFNDLKAEMNLDGETEKRLRAACEAFTNVIGKPAGTKENEPLNTKQLVFLTPKEIANAKKQIRQLVESDEKLTKTALTTWTSGAAEAIGLHENPGDGIDMALFGRMTTDKAQAFAAVDAAMQVAHAITVHVATPEVDWFSAVDDLTREEGGTGGGHLGETEFNSGVYYKYFSCNYPLLVKNMRGDEKSAAQSLTALLKAACLVTPSGKQNSFASHSPADTVLLIVRDENVPVSLANAFETPVQKNGEGYLPPAREKLLKQYKNLKRYGLNDQAFLFNGTEEAEQALTEVIPAGVIVKSSLDDLFKELRTLLDMHTAEPQS